VRWSAESARHIKVTGSPTWARTRDLRINSPSLYRLSYRGMEARYDSEEVFMGQRKCGSLAGKVPIPVRDPDDGACRTPQAVATAEAWRRVLVA